MDTNVVWELSVYAPKSEDPTETTLLTPRAGSPHSDPFVVRTASGAAGTQPYLGIPKGRTGAIDPVTKRTTTGNLTLEVFDPRIVAGGGNAQRWSTAFIGDAFGRPRMKGCRWVLKRSLNGGAMTTYQTGRIRNTSVSRPLWLTLDVKDFADDLTRPIFTGAPHASVASYAAPPALLPLGAAQAWGNLAVTPALSGTLTKRVAGANGAPDEGDLVITTPASPADAMVTKTLLDAGKSDTPRIVQVTIVSSGATVYFRWPATQESTKLAADGRTMISSREYVISGGPVKHYGVQKFPVWTLPTTDTRYAAFPAAIGTGVAVTVRVFLDAPPSKSTPILINDVHPVQFWADIIDGKYSRTYDYDALRPLAGRDTSAGGPWDVLLSDPSFGKMRDLVDQQWDKGSDYIEKVICQRYNLAYHLDELGRVVPRDLRRSASLAGVPTLTDDDLVTEVEPSWDDSRDGAITAVVYDYQVDTRLNAPDLIGSSDTYPDVVPALVASEKSSVLIPNDLSTFRDVGEKLITIDARGTRVSTGDWLTAHFGRTRLDRVKAELLQAATDFLRPFGAGQLTASLTYRAASALAAAVRPGDYRIVDHAKLPNPATNQRGGPRLMLALSVNDVDPGRIAIKWLDAGSGAVAVTPVISSIAAASSTAIDAAVVLNAAGDPLDLWIAVTDTTVGVRPADNAAEWVYQKTVSASSTVRVTSLPGSKRIWARAQAHGSAANVKLPSGWAYPPAPGYVDLGAAAAIDDGAAASSAPPLATTSDIIAPPTAGIDLVSEDDTQVTLATSGAVGAGGAGPLQYSWRTGSGAWSAYSTSHPNQSIPRAPKLTKSFQLKVKQADGQESAPVSYPVTGALTAIATGTGQVDPTQTLSGTSHFIPRATDVNGMNLAPGATDSRARLLNTGFQYGTDSAAGVVETSGQKFIHGSYIDGSRRPNRVYSATDASDLSADTMFEGWSRTNPVIADRSANLTAAVKDSRASLLNAHFRSNVDTIDSIVEGTGSPIAGGKRGYQALDASNYLQTGVRGVAVIGDRTAGRLVKQNGAYFAETWDVVPSAASGWSAVGTFGLANDTNSTMGPTTLVSTGYATLRGPRLAFNPNKLYRFRAKMRTAAYNSGGAGSSLWYIGVFASDYAGSPTNSNAGACYVCMAGEDPAGAVGFGGYVERVAWVKGASVAGGGGIFSFSLDPRAPQGLNTGTTQIEPLIYMGYAGSGGTFLFDYFLIDEFDEDGSMRTYSVIQSDNASLYGTVKDSRAALLNTMGRANVDLVSVWLDGGGYAKVAASNVDGSGNVIGAAVSISSLVGTANLSLNQLTVTFSTSGMPAGVTYNVWYSVDATTTGSGTSGGLDNTSSGHVFSIGTFPSSTPSGTITVDAILNGRVIATKRRAGAFAL